MNRLHFGHLLILWSFIGTSYAKDLDLILSESAPSLERSSCEEGLGKLTQELDGLKTEDYQVVVSTLGHKKALDKLWSYKLKLHGMLRSEFLNGSLEEKCATALRGTLRALRTVEDILSEHKFRNDSNQGSYSDHAFGEGNSELRVNPEFKNFSMMRDLQSGDIILSRGNAYTSSAISHLGEFDTQYSHLSVVYKDELGKFWTVEAHIEVGVFVRPLEDHRDDKNFRTMVYRFEDKDLAHKSAEYIFKKVKSASDSTGNIFYDFGFNPDDSTQLFCSEVASYAYSFSSNGEVNIPLFRSELLKRKPEFVRMLGIEVNKSFIPADIEVDPRFKIVTEWRDPKKINNNLEKDSIMQSMFKWSDDLGYRMVQASSKNSLIYRNVAWPLRRIPFLKKYVINKLPLNMSRKLIGYFGVLESIGEFLQKDLKPADEKSIKETGFPLMGSDKAKLLEETRLKDLGARKKVLHRMYRPLKS